MRLVNWYYHVGPKGASWLNAHAGLKPLVRAGLIVPVSISKILFTSKALHKIAALLIILSCFGFAYGAGKHEEWTWRKTIFVGSGIAFLAIIVYGIVMTPKIAKADRATTSLDSQRVYFLYEDHIGRPVLMSEYADYDEDDSYFTDDNENGDPYYQVYYNMPFGATDYWASTGITIGDPNTTGIVWLVPFKYPGQYQDFVDNLDLYYNWNRWYMPGMGRYTQADPFLQLTRNYIYAQNNPLYFVDLLGLWTRCTEWEPANNILRPWVTVSSRPTGVYDVSYMVFPQGVTGLCMWSHKRQITQKKHVYFSRSCTKYDSCTKTTTIWGEDVDYWEMRTKYSSDIKFSVAAATGEMVPGFFREYWSCINPFTGEIHKWADRLGEQGRPIEPQPPIEF